MSPRKRRAGCFTWNAFLMSCDVSVLYIFLTVWCVGLQCVIVAFPVHTHLLVL